MSRNYFSQYVTHAPFALARERSLELYLMQTMKPKKEILDIACGDGYFTSLLFSHQYEPIYGIDLNPSEVKKALSYINYKEVLVMDATKMTFKPANFSTIFSNSSLEHIPNIGDALTSIREIMSDDGELFLTLPTDKFEHYSVGGTFLDFFKMQRMSNRFRILYNKFWHHYHAYPAEKWQIIFEEYGFAVEECTEYGSKLFCFINDLTVLPGIIGKINMLIFKKWKIMEPFWIYISRLIELNEPFIIEKEVDITNGGLVFFKLKKKF
jgi:ubiquinone/menaquinone biosynthesis C-methylase UbiE